MTSSSPPSRRRAVWWMIATAVLFSTGGAAVKATDLDAWQVAAGRSAIAAVALVLLLPQCRRGWSARTVLVGVAYAATLVLFVHANKLTTAASTIFLQATAPLWVMVAAPLLLREPLRRTELMLGPLFGAGIVLLLVDAVPVSVTAPRPALGNALALASGVTYALAQVGLRALARPAPEATTLDRPREHDPGLAAVLCGNLLAVLLCLPWLRLPAGGGPGSADLVVLVYLGVFQVGLAYLLMTRALRTLGAVEASFLLLLEPVLSPLWAWLLHGEMPGPWSWAGGALVLAATALKVRRAGQLSG